MIPVYLAIEQCATLGKLIDSIPGMNNARPPPSDLSIEFCGLLISIRGGSRWGAAVAYYRRRLS